MEKDKEIPTVEEATKMLNDANKRYIRKINFMLQELKRIKNLTPELEREIIILRNEKEQLKEIIGYLGWSGGPDPQNSPKFRPYLTKYENHCLRFFHKIKRACIRELLNRYPRKLKVNLKKNPCYAI